MSFIRPEARAGLIRWREALIGLGALLLGVFFVLGPAGLLGWIGWALVIVGAGYALAGIQRGRFRAGSDGIGVVQVDEGQILYFGPLTGGSVALRDLRDVHLVRQSLPAHWKLTQTDGVTLAIPVDAKGVEALFDAFSALPGFRAQPMLGALKQTEARDDVLIWGRPSAPVSPATTAKRLH
ncbi:MAG: hypothetical protein AB8B51_19795 [Sedimentitalea sp.]